MLVDQQEVLLFSRVKSKHTPSTRCVFRLGVMYDFIERILLASHPNSHLIGSIYVADREFKFKYFYVFTGK